MPIAPPRICGTCGQIACQGHQKAAWTRTKVPPPRIRGRKLQAIRARLFDRQPLCVVCQAQGRTTIATIRDHVVPLTDHGRDDEFNHQPLCVACHDVKSETEKMRGLRRNRKPVSR